MSERTPSDERTTDDELAAERDLDPGAYIGHEPELAADRLPDGPQPGDARVAAHAVEVGPEGDPDRAADDDRREAGQDR